LAEEQLDLVQLALLASNKSAAALAKKCIQGYYSYVLLNYNVDLQKEQVKELQKFSKEIEADKWKYEKVTLPK
jgi:hypothetical protein